MDLETVHPFYGITYLVFKKGNLPIGNVSEFAINQADNQFLIDNYQTEKNSSYYFRVFRVSDKSQYWLRSDYASSGLQAIRTQTFGTAFLHETGTNLWGWVQDYVSVLRDKLPGNRPIPAFSLAVWLFRNVDWQRVVTPQVIIKRLFHEFNISPIEQAELFDASSPSEIDDWMKERPFSWADLTENLNIPPPTDVPSDEGGTLTSLALTGVGPAHQFQMNLAKRVNLLTGDNGLGKSFVLETAWWALTGRWVGLPILPREDAKLPRISYRITGSSGRSHQVESRYDWALKEWSSQNERPTVPGLLIYARVDGAFAVWDPARDYWGNADTTVRTRPIVFSRDEVWDGMQDNSNGRTVFISNGLISDWIHWQNSPDRETFETLRRVLKRLSPPDLDQGDLGCLEPGKPTRIPMDSRWMPTIRHSYGEIPLVHASAGVRRVVALAYLIVWAWLEHKEMSRQIRRKPERDMMFLVDEIEAHLHPKWQRRILPALLDVREDLGPELRVQLLVATHSPLVMASVEPIFNIDEDKIFHLNLETQDLLGTTSVELQEPEFSLYGSVDSWLRSQFFELAQPRSEEAEKAIEDAKKLQSRHDQVTKEEVEEVSNRLQKFLPPFGDGFWPRWTYFAQLHGVDL